MNAIHGGTGTLVEKRPVVEEQKKTVAGSPLNVRNFNLLFGGQTISVIGDALYPVALPWLVLTTGGSAKAAGNRAGGLWHSPCAEHAGGWLALRSSTPAKGDADRGRGPFAAGCSPDGDRRTAGSLRGRI